MTNTVFTTCIIDPSNFYARFGEEEVLNAEEEIEQLISEYVRNPDRIRNDEKTIVVNRNDVILAKSNEQGGKWLRATVVSNKSSDVDSEVDVMFTGYGMTELVEWNDVLISVPDFAADWEMKAECFTLHNIQPIGGSWSSDAINYFADCVWYKQLSSHKVRSEDDDSAISSLVIYGGKDGQEGDTIQDQLISRGFATRCKGTDATVASHIGQSASESSILSSTSSSDIPQFNLMFLDSVKAPNFSQPPPRPPRPLTPADDDTEVQLLREMYGVPANGPKFEEPSDLDPRNRTTSDVFHSIRKEIDDAHQSESRHKHRREKSRQRIIESRSSCSSRSSVRSGYNSNSFANNISRLLHAKKPLEDIRGAIIPVLAEDDYKNERFVLCIDVLVDETLKSDTLTKDVVKILASIKNEIGFGNSLKRVLDKCQQDYVKVVPRCALHHKARTFAGLLGHLFLALPNESQIVQCIARITERWAVFGVKNRNFCDDQLLEVYARCLGCFVEVVSDESADRLVSSFEFTMKSIDEKLFSNVMPRIVKKILLDLLLHVERRKTEQRKENREMENGLSSSNTEEEQASRMDGSGDLKKRAEDPVRQQQQQDKHQKQQELLQNHQQQQQQQRHHQQDKHPEQQNHQQQCQQQDKYQELLQNHQQQQQQQRHQQQRHHQQDKKHQEQENHHQQQQQQPKAPEVQSSSSPSSSSPECVPLRSKSKGSSGRKIESNFPFSIRDDADGASMSRSRQTKAKQRENSRSKRQKAMPLRHFLKSQPDTVVSEPDVGSSCQFFSSPTVCVVCGSRGHTSERCTERADQFFN